jgi:hypothetical protein
VVAASSLRVARRLAAERPGTTASTSASSAAVFSSVSSTTRAVPCATTDR